VRAAARFGLVVLLCAGASGLVPAAAYADSATPPAVKTAWYWSLVVPDAGGNKLPVGAPSQTSGVPDGDLGVGYTVDQAGTYDKVAAVAFDMSAVPAGATFSSFVVSAAYDPAATQLTSGTPDVSACELLDAFVDSSTPKDLATAPPISLPSCVKGTFVASIGTAGGYQFDLTAVANDWSGGAPAQGIMLRPTAGLATPQPPFTVSFLGKSGITTSADYTVPAPTTVPPAPAPGPVLAPPPPLPAVGLPPVLPGVVVPAPVVPAPAPQVNPAPQPAVAAASYTPGALVPGGAWWLALLGLLAMLGLTAAVLGDPLAPVVVDARRRRFAEVVRTQARTTAPAAGRASRPSPRFRPA
jgi:hypothetical protein